MEKYSKIHVFGNKFTAYPGFIFLENDFIRFLLSLIFKLMAVNMSVGGNSR